MNVIQPTEKIKIENKKMKKLEDEHLWLQRQVRIIQIDRQHRTMGVHPQFRRQDMLMQTLKKEYLNLCKDLKIARSGAHKKKDKKMKIELQKSLLFRVAAQQKCDAHVSMMQQYNDLIQKNYKETMNLRKLASTTQGEIEERRWQSEYRLMSAENKLEAAKMRFNAVQYENKKIREEIEHMLRDRALFNQAWNKMQAALSKGKKFLYDLFESSTLAYDQRDEWCTKLKTMQEKGKIDQDVTNAVHPSFEMRDLVKAFDHEMKVYQFLATKGMARVNKTQELREEKQRKLDEENRKKQYQYHVELLDEISEYTGENSTRRILDQFKKKEQENFSIYVILTEYCAENEVLRRDVQDIRQQIYDRREWMEQKENRLDTKIEDLRNLLAEQKARTDALRKKNEEKDQLIQKFMNHINDMFTRSIIVSKIWLDGVHEPYTGSLEEASNTSCTVGRCNFKLIGLVEHCLKKSNKSGRLKKYTLREEPQTVFKPTHITTLVPADPCPSCVEARWLSRIFDGTELPFDKNMALNALKELSSDPAYMRSDRVHTIMECIVPRSRAILARRYVNQ
ncbi:hypothetical protein HW555_007138 [Spodoptera exigua]|uniref:ODAD1 central coiled coil region domain-containing protein n=1 Tax=Spodoptera exigua TaxID=7107 RepID=A0A835L3X9_SPOEX|nr:hypothetical protein HW555_007138 [Spodoptera exigua]